MTGEVRPKCATYITLVYQFRPQLPSALHQQEKTTTIPSLQQQKTTTIPFLRQLKKITIPSLQQQKTTTMPLLPPCRTTLPSLPPYRTRSPSLPPRSTPLPSLPPRSTPLPSLPPHWALLLTTIALLQAVLGLLLCLAAAWATGSLQAACSHRWARKKAVNQTVSGSNS